MGEKTPSFPLFPALVLFGVLGFLMAELLADQPRIPPAMPATPTIVAVVPTPTATAVEQTVAYSDDAIRQGQALFSGTCAACHGPDAHGIPGLGKNLAASTFVHGLNDAELLQFIITGRPITDPLNTTGVAMPPRGGNPGFSDDQLNLIIAYIRSLQAKEVQVAAAATPVPMMTVAPHTLPIAGMNFENVVLPQRTFNAAEAYALSCSGCHGAQGEGGSASALTSTTMSDDDLFAFLTNLQPPVDPYTAFPHPVRGDYPELNDDQLRALIQYLHTLPAS